MRSMKNNQHINGAHAACSVKTFDILSKPTGYALGEIQTWIKQDNNFSNRKSVLSDKLVQEAMQWWAMRPYGNGGFESYKQAQKKLKAYLFVQAKEQYSVFQGIIFYLFISSVVSVVTKMIINWLFGHEKEQKIVYENRGIYVVVPIVPYKAGM